VLIEVARADDEARAGSYDCMTVRRSVERRTGANRKTLRSCCAARARAAVL